MRDARRAACTSRSTSAPSSCARARPGSRSELPGLVVAPGDRRYHRRPSPCRPISTRAAAHRLPRQHHRQLRPGRRRAVLLARVRDVMEPATACSSAPTSARPVARSSVPTTTPPASLPNSTATCSASSTASSAPTSTTGASAHKAFWSRCRDRIEMHLLALEAQCVRIPGSAAFAYGGANPSGPRSAASTTVPGSTGCCSTRDGLRNRAWVATRGSVRPHRQRRCRGR